jgi:hypothetical protein
VAPAIALELACFVLVLSETVLVLVLEKPESIQGDRFFKEPGTPLMGA